MRLGGGIPSPPIPPTSSPLGSGTSMAAAGAGGQGGLIPEYRKTYDADMCICMYKKLINWSSPQKSHTTLGHAHAVAQQKSRGANKCNTQLSHAAAVQAQTGQNTYLCKTTLQVAGSILAVLTKIDKH